MRIALLAIGLCVAACSSAEAPVTVGVDAAEEIGDDVGEDVGEDTGEAVDEGVADTRATPDTKPPADTAVADTAPPAPCSDLTLPAAIDGDRWGTAQPKAVGGMLPSAGTWDLFSARQYGATSGPLGKFAGAFRIKADKYDLRLVTPTGAIESSGTFKTAGTAITFAPTCTIGAFPTTLGYDDGLTYVRLHTSTTIYSFKTR